MGWSTAARRTATGGGCRLRLTDEGVRVLAHADHAVDAYLESIAGYLPDKDEATALRSLELWGRAMAAHREGPGLVGGGRLR